MCSSVCGGNRVNNKENGTGNCCEYSDYEEKDILVHTDFTLFPNGLDENGLATTDKQVSLHLTATDRAHDIIPEGCWSEHESYRNGKADSSNVSNGVLIGSVVTDSDVTEEVVASCVQVVSCDHGMGISSSNGKCEGEEEDDNSFNNASIEGKCVKMHLQKTAVSYKSVQVKIPTVYLWKKMLWNMINKIKVPVPNVCYLIFMISYFPVWHLMCVECCRK